MNKSKSIFWAAFLILGALVFVITIFSVNTSAGTIRVDDNGGEDYIKIQDAINASNIGDTIYIHSGTYYENIVISKSIDMIGENPETTIIDGGNTTQWVVYIDTNSAIVHNFTITNGTRGVYVVSGRESNHIEYNTITKCQNGIRLYEASKNNIIQHNTLLGCSYSSIVLSGARNNTLAYNTIKNSGANGIFMDSDSANNTITNNIIENSTTDGIRLSGWTDRYYFYDLTSGESTTVDIYFPGSSNNTIALNTIDRCADGIFSSDSNNNTFMGNTIMNCNVGINFGNTSSNNRIFSNSVINNAIYGIFLSGGSNNNTITSNNIYGNRQYGLYLESSIGNTAINNWWGSANGPCNTISNPSGTGDDITDSIPFSPWATSRFDISDYTTNLPGTPDITTIPYTDTDSSYSINWSTSDYATNYILEENYVEIYNGTNITYSVTGKPDGTYIYRIRAWNSNGTSNWSAVFTIIVDNPKSPSVPTFITTPPYPYSGSSYSISWTSSAYAAKYILEENSIEIYNGTDTTHQFAGKADGTYNYTIRAWNINGTSNWSSAVAIIVDNAKLPGTPSFITAPFTDTDGSYSITWATSPYATRYVLEENGIDMYNTTYLTCALAGKADGTYTYKVKAWNANGSSAYSSEVTIVVSTMTIKTNKPPTVSITSQFSGKVNGIITIRGNATDDVSVLQVEIKVDNGRWKTLNGTYSWSHMLDTIEITDGEHTVTVRAYDGTQYSNETSLEIDVNNIEPPQNEDGYIPGFELLMLVVALGVSAFTLGRFGKR